MDIDLPTGGMQSIPIKGLHGQTMPFQQSVTLMKQEAHSQYRESLRTHPHRVQGRLWT